MQNTVTVAHDPFAGPAIEKVIHITPSQAEIWIGCKLGNEAANRAYNESISLILNGELDKKSLDYAIQKLVGRHEALRSSFSPDGSFMTIFKELPIIPFYKDLSKYQPSKVKNSVAEYLEGDANYNFDLVRGPLLKVGLLKLSKLKHQLIITAHHIICDGWSMGIILQDIGSLYSAHVKGVTPSLPQPETFSSYADEQQEFIKNEEFKTTQNYWLKQYEASVPTVNLPTDFPRPEIRTFKSNRLDFPIDLELVAELKKVGIQSGSSLVATMMTAFEIFLYFQTGQDDLVLGLPAAGQSISGKSQLVGHCVNLLPLRSKIISNTPFNRYLKQRKEEIFDAYDHQKFSFGQLLEKLNIERDTSRIPLVPVVFNIDMGMSDDVVFSGLNYELKSNPRAYESFELFLNATGTENELILEWSYNAALFTPSTIERMMASFNEVLQGIIANPSVEIGKIIDADDSAYLELNNTAADYPQLPLHELLANQAHITPLNQAIKFGTSEITYEELEKQVHKVAHYLKENGLSPSDCVGVSLPKSIELVVTLIAIMECGAAFLPLDPKFPSKRLEFMLEDSNAKYIITDNPFSSELPSGVRQLLLEEIFKDLSNYPSTPPNIKVNNDTTAYLLYTSGSTGKPKGVPVTHKSLVNLLFSVLEKPGIKATDILISITTISFDISVAELFAPLLKGAKLVLTDKETAKDTRILLNLIKDEAITMMQATPTTWQMLLESGWENHLPIRALSTGEALPLEMAKTILGKVDELWNLYGPTETTIWSTMTQIKDTDNLIHIGRPLANTQLYIVNDQLNLVAPGIIGELCIAGVGVAKGYWKRPDLSAEKFIKNNFDPTSENMLYRTGDLAKLLPSGDIQCLGRIDEQVKIRGHRIELGEIESAINNLEGIKQSIVVASNELAGETRLIAYIKAEKKFQDINDVRSKLKETLPDILRPTNYMFIEDFPVTPNGKIDKKKLPRPKYVRSDSSNDIKTPQTKLEKEIAQIWSEMLQIPVIDINDDFFEMGGSSLIAQRVIGVLRKKLNKEIPLINIFQYPTISQLAEFLGENLKVKQESETVAKIQNAKVIAAIRNSKRTEPQSNFTLKRKTDLVIDTTKAQSEILTDCFFGGDDAKRAYNISLSLKFIGKLKYDALEMAIQSLVERHESLRSSFSEDLNSMKIYTDFHIDILFHDISNQSETEKEKSKESLIKDDVNFLFDLVNGPLLRFSLVKTNELEHELILLVNHAVCDGLSTSIMLEELSELYTAFGQDKIPNLNAPDSFSLFANKENKFTQSAAYKRSVEFWLNMYQNSIPKLELPIDYPRPEFRTYNNHHLDFFLDNGLLNSLKQIGNNGEPSMFTSMVTKLIAAFEIFLYKQTGQNDLVLGLTSSRRANYDMMQMIGHSVNLLPLRSKIDSKTNFKDYLLQRNKQLFDAYENQSISFGHLLRRLSVPRDASRVPLVPVIVNIQLEDVLESENSFFDLKTEITYNENNFRTFEIELQVFMSEKGPCFRWRYNTTLFKPETIKRMMSSFKEVLLSIVANPSIEISNIVQIDDSAYLKLNDTSSAYPQLPLHELILKQYLKSPNKKAISFGNQVISYGELEKKTHQLAHYLKQQGIAPGDYIAVSLPRSIELITTLLAIMECGAAYVPLDPSYPSKRLEFMLLDSEAKYMITEKSYKHSFKSDTKILFLETLFEDLATYPDTPLSLKVGPNEIAYLLYTSGSTGKPKGVSVTHKNLVNLLSSVLLEPGIQQTDRILSITTISFDIAGFELYGALLAGAELVLTNEETSKDPRLLLDILRSEDITMMEATPATWQMLLDAGWKEKLSIKALCTGEALPLVLAKRIIGKVNELWNLYGPTETTIWSSLTKVSASDEIITIGKPIANTQLYIVNEQGNLVEPGKIGELYIAGDGVAKGYWKRPDLTAEKFIENKFAIDAGKTLYRTGDLAKLLPTGEVQCLGRIDQQIKIRGHRIELGEIEQALDSLEGIESSVVLFHEDKLIANICTTIGDTARYEGQLTKWKEILRNQLPMHMVPQQFNMVSEFPTTLNGKIDRKKLAETLPKENLKTGFTEPASASEKIIAEVWKKCLKLDKIGVDSDFFELGGHSVIAVRVMTMLEEKTGNRLPLVALLKHPTVKKLAAYMDSEFIVWDSLVPLKPEGTKPPLYIVHGAHHNVLIFNELAQNLDKDQPVYGLQARGLDGVAEPHDSMHDMARDYIKEIQITNPNGPYCLAGFSLGGTIAFEMARQLREQGKEVKIVAEFDTYVFPDYYFKSAIKKRIVGLTYTALKVGYVLLNMFTSKKNFKRRTGLFMLHIKGLILRLKHGKEKQHEMQFHRVLKMEQNHLKATDTYHIRPQDIVIDLFKAEEEINLVHDKKYLGWNKFAKKGVRRHMVPGNHIDMFDKGNVEVFAKSLQYVLDNHNSESVQ
ncbi:amino acid adenylation domain-containing protein [Maribacter chungangensis]|uniref:Amino acid adenylation domain-containing protein n=1 Tax=Maribacter chungangensis TaxID=1069117 RepID=A0ABW3B620_9FLAO